MENEPIKAGIRGWLIPATALLFLVPGNLLAHARSIAREFDEPAVRAMCDPASPLFDPRWKAFVFSETTGFVLVGYALMFISWPLFLFRHRGFRWATALLVAVLGSLLIARAALATGIPTVAAGHRISIYGQTAVWLPVCAALAAYALRSRRVGVTFSRRFMLSPAFPFFTRI